MPIAKGQVSGALAYRLSFRRLARLGSLSFSLGEFPRGVLFFATKCVGSGFVKKMRLGVMNWAITLWNKNRLILCVGFEQ